MKINRLLEIILILLNKKSTTAKTLADRFDVSVRTIYRDIDELTLSGIPIYTAKGKGGGIYLLEDYKLNSALMTDKDTESMFMALQTLKAADYPDADHVLTKLGAIFTHAQPKDWIEVDFSPWEMSPNTINSFTLIKNCILNQQVLFFDYVNASNNKTSRKVEPLKLFFKSRYWYLIAFCRLKKAQRVFKLVRMQNVTITSEKFIRKEPEPLTMWQHQEVDMPLVPVHLRFDNAVLYRLYDEFNASYLSIGTSSTDIIVDLPIGEWIYSYLLTFGIHVQIVSPASLKENFAKHIKKIYDASL